MEEVLEKTVEKQGSKESKKHVWWIQLNKPQSLLPQMSATFVLLFASFFIFFMPMSMYLSHYLCMPSMFCPINKSSQYTIPIHLSFYGVTIYTYNISKKYLSKSVLKIFFKYWNNFLKKLNSLIFYTLNTQKYSLIFFITNQ